MPVDPSNIGVPIFSRQISYLRSRLADETTEEGQVSFGVLSPLTPLLAGRERAKPRESDSLTMPSLSYLTLQPLVRRTLVERTNRDSKRGQPQPAESSDDERSERRVYELLQTEHGGRTPGKQRADTGFDERTGRSGEESESDVLSMDLVGAQQPSRERALTGDDPTGVDSAPEGEHDDSGRTRDAGTGDATGRRPRLATLDRLPTTIRRRATTETPGTVLPFSDSAVSPEFGTSAPDQDERSLWSGDDAGVAGDDMRTAPGESTDVGASPASRPLADDVVSSTNRETRLSDQRADPAMTYREPESTRRPGQTNASDTGRSVDTAAQTVDRSPGDADNGRERSEREETTQAPDPDVDVDRLVDRVYDEFQRKLRIERERRGL